MRSIRAVATRRLRAPIAPQTSSPFLTRQAAAPCPFCAYLTPSRLPSRRFQSTSTTTPTPPPTTETPFDTQPSQPQTHYTFFPNALPLGPPPTGPFTIDLTALKKEFLQLQARAHPDLHPPSSKKRAEGLSARINDAYKTLQHPLLRAQYLLSLRGIDSADDETATVEDPELLMEVLEAREQIEDARDEEELVGMKQVNEERIRESVGVLERGFAEDDMETVKGEVVRLRYWVNIRESIEGWEEGKPVVLNH